MQQAVRNRLFSVAMCLPLAAIVAGCSKASPPPLASIASPANVGARGQVPPEFADDKNDPGAVSVKRFLDERPHLEAADLLGELGNFLREHPTNIAAYSAHANQNLKLGRAEEAVQDLTQALQISPTDVRLLNNRGFAHLANGNYDLANRDLAAATKLCPDFPKPYNQRGLIHIAQGHFHDALDELNKALRLDPGYVDAWNNRGFVHLELGHIAPALADLNAAIKLNPKYVNAYNNRGLLKFRAGDYEEALYDFTSAMMLDPTNPKYYEHRQQVYVKQGDTQRAEADAKKIAELATRAQLTAQISMRPGDLNLVLARAEGAIRSGDINNAKSDLARILKSQPDHERALIIRARMWFSEGLTDAALDDCESVLKNGPSAEAVSIRGDCHFARKDFVAAVADYEAARRIDDRVSEAYRGLAELRLARGETAAAEDARRRAQAIDADTR